MFTLANKLNSHNQRASSARSERVESLTQKRMGWQQTVSTKKQKDEDHLFAALEGNLVH
jgi:hypothetical protein